MASAYAASIPTAAHGGPHLTPSWLPGRPAFPITTASPQQRRRRPASNSSTLHREAAPSRIQTRAAITRASAHPTNMPSTASQFSPAGSKSPLPGTFPGSFRGTPSVATGPVFSRSRRGGAARAGPKSLIPSHGYDYYELLGVPVTAAPEDIKAAYRRLQKRCHPDVAGREDMAILLNEAYSTLSDPIMRFTYDQLRVTWVQDEDFSGKPVYSTWHGSEEEETAVFVDEVSCIGCLNCALIAERTFAIELKHGRARAIRQWADDEESITAAMQSCPVSCIKWVERSKLAALEHTMMQLPRPSLYSLAVGGDGRKLLDVFAMTDKFLRKRKTNELEIEEAKMKREEAKDAFNAIKNWWVSKGPSGASGDESDGEGRSLVLAFLDPEEAARKARELRQARSMSDGEEEFVPDDLRALHNAAAAVKGRRGGRFFTKKVGDHEEEYWNPTTPAAAPANGHTQGTPADAAAFDPEVMFVDSADPVPHYAPDTDRIESPSGLGGQPEMPRVRPGPAGRTDGVPGETAPVAEAVLSAAPASASKDQPLGSYSEAGFAKTEFKKASLEAAYAAPSADESEPEAPAERGHASGVPGQQFIDLNVWPEFKYAEQRRRKGQILDMMVYLPIMSAIAAGTWSWAGPTSVMTAASAASRASGIKTVLPPDVVASVGMEVVLCMAVWAAIGGIVAQGLGLVLSLVLKVDLRPDSYED